LLEICDDVDDVPLAGVLLDRSFFDGVLCERACGRPSDERLVFDDVPGLYGVRSKVEFAAPRRFFPFAGAERSLVRRTRRSRVRAPSGRHPMSRSRVTQVVGALLVCFTVASPLRAAEPSASAPAAAEGRVANARGAEDPDNEPDENLPPAARAERAREQGHLGLAAFAERRWEAALDHFTRAERWM